MCTLNPTNWQIFTDPNSQRVPLLWDSIQFFRFYRRVYISKCFRILHQNSLNSHYINNMHTYYAKCVSVGNSQSQIDNDDRESIHALKSPVCPEQLNTCYCFLNIYLSWINEQKIVYYKKLAFNTLFFSFCKRHSVTQLVMR